MVKTLARSIREFKKPAILTPLLVTVEVILECIIPFTIANLVNLSIRVIFAVTMAPRFGIQMVWCAVPIGWFSNWLISFLEYRTGKWRKKAVAFSG